MTPRLLLALAVLGLAPVAQAQSGRWGSFELSGGPYWPDLDSEFPAGSPGPYERVFGKKPAWMFRVGVSKALLTTSFGTLEAGFRTGWMRKSGRGRFTSDGTVSPDPTSLLVFPTTATVTLRVDWLAEHYRWVPLAVYGRAALERYHWWIKDGGGGVAQRGATNGWSWAGGAALLLDAFDPGMARELDRDTGINHTYLFFEAGQATVDDFGSSSSFDFSSDGWTYTGGLMLVF